MIKSVKKCTTCHIYIYIDLDESKKDGMEFICKQCKRCVRLRDVSYFFHIWLDLDKAIHILKKEMKDVEQKFEVWF